jgi:pyruvate dehydrogenase E1 component alpha subunit
MRYRDVAEIAEWKARDPLDIQAARVPAGVRERIDTEVEAELDDVVAFAVGSAKPDPADALEFMYASGLRARGGAVD